MYVHKFIYIINIGCQTQKWPFLEKIKLLMSIGLLEAHIGLWIKVRCQDDRQVSYTMQSDELAHLSKVYSVIAGA